MISRHITRAIVVLSATAALAQSALPGTTQGAPMMSQQDLAGRRGVAMNRTSAPQGLTEIRQRVVDMDYTLSKMRVLLKQMHTRTAKSNATDSLTKANLDMWDLMVGDMDKELQQLRSILAAREDMEVRRAALYRQADAKIEAQAQAARAAQAERFAEAANHASGTQISSQATSQSAQQNTSPHSEHTQPPAALANPPN